MCALRQFVEPAHPGLRPAAARAQQIPAHRDDAVPRRRQEQFDGMVGWDGPDFRQRNGANAAKLNDRRMPQDIDQVRRETMRSGIARQLPCEHVKAAAGRRFREILYACPRDMRWTFTLANEPLNRRQRPAKFSIHDTGMSRHKSQQADGFRHTSQDSRQPSLSANSSQPHSKRRIGPFWYSRAWKRR